MEKAQIGSHDKQELSTEELRRLGGRANNPKVTVAINIEGCQGGTKRTQQPPEKTAPNKVTVPWSTTPQQD